MPLSLKELAELAQDLYYRDYPDRVDFFDLDDFMLHAAMYYSQSLNTIYQATKRENKQQEGFANMENSAAWLIEETQTVARIEESDEYYTTPTQNIFSFNFDAFANGLSGVKSTGKGCNGKKYELIKISANEIRFLPLVPETGIVYYWVGPNNRIYFNKNVNEVTIWYVPAVVGNNGDCLLSDSIAADVIKNTLMLMFGAKQGNIVQESNDGNKNLIEQQQTNPNLNKNLAQAQ